jgi:hypothetical protein
METLTVTILEPKARKLLDDLASLNLIKLEKTEDVKKKERQFGALKGLRKAGSAEGKYKLASDFDAPLEDFKEYM